MIDPWKIINELESNNSRLFKEDVIEKNLSYKNFQEGLAMCLDPLVTFGVKQVPESEKNGVGLAWIDFKKGANLLKRYISENNKLLSSKITSVSSGKQKKLTREIKKAKILGLI